MMRYSDKKKNATILPKTQPPSPTGNVDALDTDCRGVFVCVLKLRRAKSVRSRFPT